MKSIELQFLRLDIPRLATDLLQILTPVQEYTFVLQVALPSVETILVTREPEYQSFALTIPNGVTVLKVLSAYFVESSEYIGNMSLHNIDNNKY